MRLLVWATLGSQFNMPVNKVSNFEISVSKQWRYISHIKRKALQTCITELGKKITNHFQIYHNQNYQCLKFDTAAAYPACPSLMVGISSILTTHWRKPPEHHLAPYVTDWGFINVCFTCSIYSLHPHFSQEQVIGWQATWRCWNNATSLPSPSPTVCRQHLIPPLLTVNTCLCV